MAARQAGECRHAAQHQPEACWDRHWCPHIAQDVGTEDRVVRAVEELQRLTAAFGNESADDAGITIAAHRRGHMAITVAEGV